MSYMAFMIHFRFFVLLVVIRSQFHCTYFMVFSLSFLFVAHTTHNCVRWKVQLYQLYLAATAAVGIVRDNWLIALWMDTVHWCGCILRVVHVSMMYVLHSLIWYDFMRFQSHTISVQFQFLISFNKTSNTLGYYYGISTDCIVPQTVTWFQYMPFDQSMMNLFHDTYVSFGKPITSHFSIRIEYLHFERLICRDRSICARLDIGYRMVVFFFLSFLFLHRNHMKCLCKLWPRTK